MASGQLVMELTLNPLPYSLLTFPFPYRKASQKGPGHSKAETWPYPENPQKWQTTFVSQASMCPSPHPSPLLPSPLSTLGELLDPVHPRQGAEVHCPAFLGLTKGTGPSTNFPYFPFPNL